MMVDPFSAVVCCCIGCTSCCWPGICRSPPPLPPPQPHRILLKWLHEAIESDVKPKNRLTKADDRNHTCCKRFVFDRSNRWSSSAVVWFERFTEIYYNKSPFLDCNPLQGIAIRIHGEAFECVRLEYNYHLQNEPMVSYMKSVFQLVVKC